MKEHLAAFNLLLTQAKKEAEEQIAQLSVVSAEHYNGDDADITVSLLESNLKREFLNRAGKNLKRINAALARIKSNVFGICENCEEEIELSRLKTRPTVTLCLSCQEHQERSNLVFGRNNLYA